MGLDSFEPGCVYVPAGWFIAGGDPEAAESLPRRRLWADGFVVQRHPVTNAEYLAFLNDEVARGCEAEALAACPRLQLGRVGHGENALAYDRGPDGCFPCRCRRRRRSCAGRWRSWGGGRRCATRAGWRSAPASRGGCSTS
ncbi:SUMF1/EgtB/PvdO family nonheme iron enzyme [Sorangium sp. So ce1099]|uniref:SUMF1/EgtB/PvdO family nonheme iron enzyme n=1 Tax=Sorangium sp. So ce1099 TaxID=3133331 RepID=UPI003F5FB442